MKALSTSPREPINQGIELDNPIVLRHNQIYETLLASVPQQQGVVSVTINPYGTAPLSGYAGFMSASTEPVRIRIVGGAGVTPVEYHYTPVIGANLAPIVGLTAASANAISVYVPGNETLRIVLTGPLPPTDEEKGGGITGFPLYEVTVPMADAPATVQELYVSAWPHRYNVGVDHTGTVRWYTEQSIPAFSVEKLQNGHYIACDAEHDEYKELYEYDVVGRVHKIYRLDNNCHHSIQQMADGNLILPSENTGESVEDGISIIDINTGLETAYYDLRQVLDTSRPPVPIDPDRELDWLHINQAYKDEANNLIIGSGRHQGVFGLNADTGELVFVLGNHEDWAEDFQQYLLTPVDANGQPLYDLTKPEDVDRADKEFWNWGQHNVADVGSSTEGVTELILFDNGNWRSRKREKALIPNDNFSRSVQYKINLTEMTVEKVYEYGKTEVGSRGYSSFVCNQQILPDGHLFVNFGGAIIDENGRQASIFPGAGDIDDPLLGEKRMGRLVLQEVDTATNQALVEFTCTSGRFNTEEEEGPAFFFDMFSFRSFKQPLLP